MFNATFLLITFPIKVKLYIACLMICVSSYLIIRSLQQLVARKDEEPEKEKMSIKLRDKLISLALGLSGLVIFADNILDIMQKVAENNLKP